MKQRYFKIEENGSAPRFKAIGESEAFSFFQEMLGINEMDELEDRLVEPNAWANIEEDVHVYELASEQMMRLEEWGEAGGPFPD